MRSLLKVDLGAICSHALVGLAKDWIKRLLKDAVVDEPAEIASDHKLQALQRIRSLCCSIEIHWHRSSEAAHRHKHGLRCHAPDWEANASQIEVATQDLASHHLSNMNGLVRVMLFLFFILTEIISVPALLKMDVYTGSRSSKPPEPAAVSVLNSSVMSVNGE